MPSQWERRAAIGATLLAAMVPVLLLTLASLGVPAPRSLLEIALAFEVALVVLAVLLIGLPARAWRFGRPHSDALYALHITGFTARPITLTEGGDPVATVRVEVRLKNSSEAVAMYHVESLELELEGQKATPEYQTRGGSIARGAETYFYCPLIFGLDPSAVFLTGTLQWTAVYGVAGKAFDVRWIRTVRINVNRFEDGAWRTDTFDMAPESHEVIRPIQPRALAGI